MRSFFATEESVGITASVAVDSPAETPQPPASFSGDRLFARIAVYDSPAAAPRIEDISVDDSAAIIESLSTRLYELSHSAGGAAPYTVIREIVENLIHADFREIVVSVMDQGHTLRFADQGPGISDKDRALLPGFTTATVEMKNYIRGVGSGFPIVKEFLTHTGGELTVEDNLGRGTVVTLRFGTPASETSGEPTPDETGEPLIPTTPPRSYQLSVRQKKVLSLVLEFGEAGPTLVSKELSVGLSTAYRDLAVLEEYGLIVSDEIGKRVLTDEGSLYLDRLFD